jgi:hypothetical protein
MGPALGSLRVISDCHVRVGRVLGSHLMTSVNECMRQLERQPKRSDGVPAASI